MEKYYNKKILELEAALSELEIESDYLTDKIEIAIPIVIKCLSELKNLY
jgi:hypothetical protein